MANPLGVETRFRQLDLAGSWALDEELTGRFTLPYIWIRRQQNGRALQNLSGVGDVSFGLDWTPMDSSEDDSQSGPWTFQFGLKAPTGEELKRPRPGVIPPSLLQLGSGTWDPLMGLQWQHGTRDWGVWSGLAVQLPVGENDAGLNPANTLSFGAGVHYWLQQPSLRLGLEWESLFRGRDYLDGRQLTNTGASLGFVVPNLVWSVQQGLWMHARYRVPVIRQVNATQLVPSGEWQIGIGMSF